MASKLEKFLSDNKIDNRRLMVASRQIERLRAEDRVVKLKQKQARKSEDAKKPEGLAKPRSGKALTDIGLTNALAGQRLLGPAKNRILRAVNHVLAAKKKDAVALDALFEPPPPKAKAADAAASE